MIINDSLRYIIEMIINDTLRYIIEMLMNDSFITIHNRNCHE